MPVIEEFSPVAATAQMARNAYNAEVASRQQVRPIQYAPDVNAWQDPTDAPGIPDSRQYGGTAPNTANPRAAAAPAQAGPPPGSTAGLGLGYDKATGATSNLYRTVSQEAPAQQDYQLPAGTQEGNNYSLAQGDDMAWHGETAPMPSLPQTMRVTGAQKTQLDNLSQISKPGTPDFDAGLRKILGLPAETAAKVDVPEFGADGQPTGNTLSLAPKEAAAYSLKMKAGADAAAKQQAALQARQDAQQARFKQQADMQLAAAKARHDLMLAEADVKAGLKQPEEARKAEDAYYAAISKADADAVNMTKDGVDNLFHQFSTQPTAPTPEQQAELARRMNAQQAALEERQKHIEEAAQAKQQRAQGSPAATQAGAVGGAAGTPASTFKVAGKAFTNNGDGTATSPEGYVYRVVNGVLTERIK